MSGAGTVDIPLSGADDGHVELVASTGGGMLGLAVDGAGRVFRREPFATESVLVGTPAAPLRKALIDSGIGEGLTGSGFADGIRQPYFTFGLKGIATAEDAALCVEHGVDLVYVSNHGGRQLDHGRGSMDVQPEVLQAVNGRARVIVDGSFTRGTDIVKVIAAGADMVGVGRLPCYGLAAAGAPGVVRVLELLEDAMRICLGLLGVDRLSGLDRSYLHAAAPVVPPSALSAFPLIGEGY